MKERILIVDDTEDMLRMLRLELETDGYQVIMARTAEEAIQKAQVFLPQLILMDIMLPDMTGAEAAKMLKVPLSTKQTPVIFITALVAKSEENSQERLKVEDHYYETIAKPINSKVLFKKIREGLGEITMK